jgi:hypothetical protein
MPLRLPLNASTGALAAAVGAIWFAAGAPGAAGAGDEGPGPAGRAAFVVRVGEVPPVGGELITTIQATRPTGPNVALTSYFSTRRRPCATRSVRIPSSETWTRTRFRSSFTARRFDRPRKAGVHQICVLVEELREGEARPSSRSRVLAAASASVLVR